MSTRTAARTALVAATGLAALALTAGPAQALTETDEPDEFTSAFVVEATPDQVINPDGDEAPGEEGATGTFELRINSELEVICYDITLTGVTGEYESPAITATHIHEAAAGEPGPPRIAFPNPEGEGDTRTASGCLEGPFTTGVTNEETGEDTGAGFSLAQIEADPAAFTGDTHTADFPAGTVRGQLTEVDLAEVGEGLAETGVETTTLLGIGAAVAAVGGGVLLLVTKRNRQHQA